MLKFILKKQCELDSSGSGSGKSGRLLWTLENTIGFQKIGNLKSIGDIISFSRRSLLQGDSELQTSRQALLQGRVLLILKCMFICLKQASPRNFETRNVVAEKY